MKNLIKKTIVMLLVVCSLVSTVGVQPVLAQDNLPSYNNKKKINKSSVPVIERVWADQNMTSVSFKVPKKYLKKVVSCRITIEKKVKGKYKKVKGL